MILHPTNADQIIRNELRRPKVAVFPLNLKTNVRTSFIAYGVIAGFAIVVFTIECTLKQNE